MEFRTASTLRAPTLPGSVPVRLLPSSIHIILTPLRSSYFNTERPGPIINRAALFSKRLLREVHFAADGSHAEDTAFTKLIISYQLVFRMALRGEHGWRTKAGWLGAMAACLVRA